MLILGLSNLLCPRPTFSAKLNKRGRLVLFFILNTKTFQFRLVKRGNLNQFITNVNSISTFNFMFKKSLICMKRTAMKFQLRTVFLTKYLLL